MDNLRKMMIGELLKWYVETCNANEGLTPMSIEIDPGEFGYKMSNNKVVVKVFAVAKDEIWMNKTRLWTTCESPQKA